MKCQIADAIAFPLSTMMRVINKVCPHLKADPNIMEISGDSASSFPIYLSESDTSIFFLGDSLLLRPRAMHHLGNKNLSGQFFYPAAAA